MQKNSLLKLLTCIAAIVIVFFIFIRPLANSIRQGLDLQGGTHVVLEAEDTEIAQVNDDAMQRVVSIMEKRINELGLTEPIIQREGERRVIIELPGIKDPDAAIQTIGKTAMLEFKDEDGNTVLTGTDLKDAQAAMNQQNNQNVVNLEFSDEGGKKFADLTMQNVGRKISILLDGEVLTDPVVREPILGGRAEISGQRTLEEAQHLAVLLRSGALPVKVNIIETRTVGPSLGQDSKDKSEFAFVIGIGAVLAFMLLFYRLSGLIADISLMAYTVMLLAILKALDATLTLPGVAGIILSIGMAVDANVLIFEHFKEEFRLGKTLRLSMEAGFDRAFTTIFDSNITTIIAAAVLFFFGTGTIRGFAITLGLGVILSMFTAITLTRYLLKWMIAAKLLESPSAYGANGFMLFDPTLTNNKKAVNKNA
ncbi:MAG: protein translocase subunit SecD [Selenomonadaceae bacterium]|nr:protein translocase subunit SecD [Selenomonadaceae bacterium]MBR1858115.1 protein translocase subunit SecD [Selenomonadaceae bacterium]